MKKIIKSIIVVFVIYFFGHVDAYSQWFFSDPTEEHGLEIEHRWRRSKLFDKNSDAILILKIKNTLEYPMKAAISVGFYKDEMLIFSSEEQEVCIAPGKTKRGGRANLRFIAEEITRADTKEENFSWDFAEIDISRVESCD